MFRTNVNRAAWYLKRGLATTISEEIIQLTFEPNGGGHRNEPFFLAEKSNVCIVCGKSDELTKHHVLPLCYKVHFPKDHHRNGSYDVLPLCVEDHEKYNLRQAERMRSLAEMFKAPVGGIITNLHAVQVFGRARRDAFTLMQHGDKMPIARKEAIQASVVASVGHLDLEKITKEPVPEAIVVTHGKLVMDQITDLDAFAIEWRNHFVESMQPKHLPLYWTPDKKIYNDADPAS